jgi:2-aminobenzoylacetyl-CoA thioesterase
MRIDTGGYIEKGLHVIGPPGMPVYLVDAPLPALFDAGMTVFAQCYVNDIRAVLGTRTPAYLFLTHVHFDHVGAAAFLKRTWPDLQVVAAERSRDILGRPGAIELITALNAAVLSTTRQEGFSPLCEQPFEPVHIDIAATPDRCFDIGSGISVQALSVPGHTRDFTSYWIAAKKILIASEAAGCDDGTGYVQPEFLVDYEGYMNHLSRLARLDADILCPGHQVVLSYEDARLHMRRSAEDARRYVSRVQALLREYDGDLERVTQQVKAEEWDPRPCPKQPEQPYLLNTRQRVRVVWQGMQHS